MFLDRIVNTDVKLMNDGRSIVIGSKIESHLGIFH